MPNYKIEDFLDNPENKNKVYGFAGKILRINLSTKEISATDIYKYIPKYLGGRMLINKLFWDEVPAGTGAYDEANNFYFMTGATTATGIPAGGRSAACTIGASNNPEMYTWGNIGGYVAPELKYCGYDGFVIEGKSDEPVIIKITDDNVEILPALEVWGMRVHQTQAALKEKFGKGYHSLVIGPAGENLVRTATITTSNDNVFGKGGFGAVWGAKKLKAVSICGSGIVAAADLKKVLSLRMDMNDPAMRPNPIKHNDHVGIPVPGLQFEHIYDTGNVACCQGCNQHCDELFIGGITAFDDTRQNHVEKCVTPVTMKFESDIPTHVGQFWPTLKNYCAPCKLLSKEFPEPDFSDPDFDGQAEGFAPDTLNYWHANYDRATLVNDMCNDLGMDKWEVTVWLQSWLSMCKQEGLLSNNDLGTGLEPDVNDPEFMKIFLNNLVYREGYYGNLFAEGMARAIREMGYDKFSDTIYHGRFSNIAGGKRMDLPVSLEGGWGHSMHWQGRGFQGSIEMPTWMGMNLIRMCSTRDAQTVEHFHCLYDHHKEAVEDPYHSDAVIDAVIHTQNGAEIKDSIISCEWQSPDPRWPSMEAEIYTAATGIDTTPEDLDDAAYRSKLIFRAILIKHHGRTRKQEVDEIWRTISIPDPWGRIADWKMWNEFVDKYYEARGWDLETGWPYRETYEKYGLKDIADEMEKLGFLPDRPAKRWSDYGEPPFVKFTENRKLEPDYEECAVI